MDDQAPNRMNSDLNLSLNLNLGPSSPVPPHPENDPASDSWAVDLEDWIGSRNNRLSMETRRRSRNILQSFQIQVPTPMPTSGEKKDVKKTEDEGSFFDCNICLCISKNPVVTCCGHLFCWACLYQWLDLHPDMQECPVCKGEVTVKTVTPIYGHGHGTAGHEPELEDDPTLRIPERPQASRVESWRQTVQRNSITYPEVDEMIHSLENIYDWMQEDSNNNNDTQLDSILASRRRMRRLENLQQVDGVVDLAEISTADVRMFSRVMMQRRQQAQRIITIARHPLSSEDRDSVSSIVAVIQSGSQNAGEIDSTSSSRRRRDGSSMVSDMDSGDSRPPSSRRRLIN